MTRVASLLLPLAILGCADAPLRGTGDLGLVVERASGSVLLIETTGRTMLARFEGLGDLSHASAVFSRDGRYAYVFGRDGGLTKVDLLLARIERRVIQASNAIGGAIGFGRRLAADPPVTLCYRRARAARSCNSMCAARSPLSSCPGCRTSVPGSRGCAAGGA